jgi:hypothetical protein
MTLALAGVFVLDRDMFAPKLLLTIGAYYE